MFPIHLFPYTNMHELNLDWVLDTVKTLKEKVEALEKTPAVPETLLTDVAELKEKVALLEEYITALNNKTVALETRVAALEQQVGSLSPLTVYTVEATVI